jgi:tyrosyl-tRNA synthetase
MKKNDPEKSTNQLDQTLTRGVEAILPDKDSLAKLMSQKKIRLYLGIDPTGALLHLGHAIVLRKLQQFAQLGHEVILLIGNGTVKIGDPSGRDESRPVLTDQEIEKNWQNWKEQASTILDFNNITIKRNGDWLDKLAYADIVRLLAKTTVQQLLERDMFQQRMANNQPIYGHEIIYPLLQGYDSVVMDVDLEIGGNDQTFNMMMGRTLQKIYNNREKWVLTTPLIEGTDGRKMSQSYDNFVALTEPANDMYGKLMSIPDELILKYFKLLTDVARDELEAMQQAIKSGENPMNFKKKLALTITNDLHSESQARQAQQYFETTVQEGGLPNKIPEVKLDSTELIVLDLLKLCQPEESNAQLKRLCQQGGVKLMPQDEKLLDPNQKINFDDQQVIKVGKRNFYKLQLN